MPKKPLVKSTLAEIDARVAEIQKMLLEGHTRAHILRFSSEWQRTERQIDEYIARATASIRELNKVTIQENMAIITAQLWESFRRGRAMADEPHCLKVLTQLSKIKGLEKNNLNLVIDDKRDLEELSDEELEAMWLSTSADDEEYDS